MNPHSLCVLNWILCDRQTQTFIDIFLILFLLFGFIISFWWRRQLMPHSLTPSRYTRKTMLHTRHSCFWLVSPFCTFLLYISYFCYVVFPLSFILYFSPWWHTYTFYYNLMMIMTMTTIIFCAIHIPWTWNEISLSFSFSHVFYTHYNDEDFSLIFDIVDIV